MFDLKKQLRWAQIKAGIIITIALVILFLSVFFAGVLEKIIYPKSEIKAAIPDVKGLKKGAPVWLFGIEEGSVEDIDLEPSFGTVVTISLDKRVLGFLKKDSTASVLTMGLLGDKYVELTPGTPKAPSLAPGDMLRGTAQIDIKDVMETGGASIQKMNDFIEKLGKLVGKIETSKGTLAKFLEDPSLYNNLMESSLSLSLAAKDIKNGHGTIGMLMKDPSLYERLASTSKSLEDFSRRLESGSGTMNKLITDDLLYDKLVGAASSMDEIGKKLNKSSGTLGKLVEDPELYDNLNKASLRIASILERIDKGEGTAGLLFRDKEMATDLKEATRELKSLTQDIREHPGRYVKFSLF